MGTGRLYGLGVGPGDPELITLKSLRYLRAASVVAYYAARDKPGNALTTVLPHLRPEQIRVPLIYPVTGKKPEPPYDYEGAMREFYDASAAQLAVHLDAGRDVVVVSEGDPLFYGSFMYLHDRLAERYPTEVVPGVCSVLASAAVLGTPLVYRDQQFQVLAATLPEATLRERLAGVEAAAIMKLGSNFAKVRRVLTELGLLERARYVERATMDGEQVRHIAEIDPESVPYFAMIVIPGQRWPGAEAAENAETALPLSPAHPAPAPQSGRLTVVGLGPGAAELMAPAVRAELDAAQDIVGYTTYVELAGPFRPDQRLLDSDNRQELARARLAFDLAAQGRRVVVVSSGDPGVFAMAAAVFEVLEQADDPAWHAVELAILPGISAAQAAAARAGAPLGHDFCVISLSDNLKPWSIIAHRLRHAVDADLVLALYNPRSLARPTQFADALAILRERRAPETPVVLGRDIGRAAESLTVTTLAALQPEQVDMRTVVIVGSSLTRQVARAAGGQWVYTPRWCSQTRATD
ncbi:precorrin-2 C20-methyltransferase / precorrin-3B C17-methyltransferase [Allochromatium warmingii]|uniref:Precorrin-2 C20-methyltransferase / precorrin-3B C17-methyltransferase n=1 Tax=Allochromatium warmingii TaxID=61595 RepID=A0A1H3BBH7_ALLWA|nr:precorrin-2 C20-methyltransferase / precorrin-3B C17-methyltransferase [Allochromatium warmingii]